MELPKAATPTRDLPADRPPCGGLIGVVADLVELAAQVVQVVGGGVAVVVGSRSSSSLVPFVGSR
jgi:hypothetical protein